MGFEEKSLVELAKIVSDRAGSLQKYLEENKLPQPTLLPSGSEDDYLQKGSKEIKAIRDELRDATKQLDALATGTPLRVFDICALDMHEATAHHLLWKYAIPKHVPQEGSISYRELAEKSGLEEDRLRRLLAFEQLNYIFTESEPDRVSHTAVTKLLSTEHGFAGMGHLLDDCYVSLTRASDAWDKWPNSQSPVHTGFQLAYNTDKDPFTEWAESAPWRVARFGQAMQFVTGITQDTIFDFDWASLGAATIVDVGGSNGHKSIAIARAAPQVTCVVQDLETTVSAAPALPPDVADRVSFEVHDMFTPQKRTHADVFFYARVFHDWPDHECRRILEQLVPSMKPGARLVLDEHVKVPPSDAHFVAQRLPYVFDMHMMLLLNARERSLQEWKTLVHDGSKGQLVFEKATSGMVSFVKSGPA